MRVPVLNYTSAGTKEEIFISIPVMDVHKLLLYLHQDVGVQCPGEKVREFWEHLPAVNMPFAQGHPAGSAGNHIPFSLYGDECCIGQDPHDKVTAMFLSMTLFRPRSVRQGQHLLFAIHEDLIIHENLRTLHPILQYIVYSANRAFEGTGPSSPRFAAVELKGDWKWHEKVLRLRPTPVSRKPCYMCDAESNDSRLRFYDTGTSERDPEWAATVLSTAEFVAKKLREGVVSTQAHAYKMVHVHVPYIEGILIHTRLQQRSAHIATWVRCVHDQDMFNALLQSWIGLYREWVRAATCLRDSMCSLPSGLPTQHIACRHCH